MTKGRYVGDGALAARSSVSKRAEDELLRLCVRHRLVPTDQADIRYRVARDVDWPYLFNLAVRHHVLPLLEHCLTAVCSDALPSAVRTAFRWRLMKVGAQNRQYARELVRLHRLAASAGIAVLAWKGPVLAATLYGDLGLRQFEDLDLLVDPGAFAAAEELFAAHGYRRTRNYGYEVTLVNESLGVSIDLHRSLSPDNFPVSIEFSRLWARRELVPLDGGSVETLAHGDLVIALCIEAVKDARRGELTLAKVADLAHLCVAVGSTDWKPIEAEARRVGAQRVLAFGTRLAADVLEIPLAAASGAVTRPERWALLLHDTEAALFDAPSVRRRTRLRGWRFQCALRERWRDRLWPYARYLHGLIAPNALDRSVLPLPPSLSLLHYGVRPVRLAHKYGARVLSQIPLHRRPVV